MKFALQNQNKDNKLLYVFPDYQAAVMQAQEFYKWWQPDEEFEIIYVESYKDVPTNVINDYIPVGSVEFCCEWFKEVYFIDVTPWNVPHNITNSAYLNRKVLDFKVKNCGELVHNIVEHFGYGKDKEYFIKSNDIIKNPINGRYKINEINRIFDNQAIDDTNEYSFQISDIIDFDSEWRCFVHNNKLIDIKCYGGDVFTFPTKLFIDNRINAINKKCGEQHLNTYTLDIAVKHMKDDIIEVHDFFACGLYGFNDFYIYPKMLISSFKDILKRYGY